MTAGTFGFGRGRYMMAVTLKADGDAMTGKGRYVAALRTDADGAWKV